MLLIIEILSTENVCFDKYCHSLSIPVIVENRLIFYETEHMKFLIPVNNVTSRLTFCFFYLVITQVQWMIEALLRKRGEFC